MTTGEHGNRTFGDQEEKSNAMTTAPAAAQLGVTKGGKPDRRTCPAIHLPGLPRPTGAPSLSETHHASGARP